MNYLFTTSATMKPYNSKNYWIDPKIVNDMIIDADNIETALIKYADAIQNKYCISISQNALKSKEPMFIDTTYKESIQIGYVITGKMDFESDYYKWSAQYINLWITISIIINPFEEVPA